MKNLKIIFVMMVVAALAIGVYVFARPNRPQAVPAADGGASVAVAPTPSFISVPPPLDPIQVPILTYHTIAPATDKPEGVMAKKYHITPEHFDAQMKYLTDNGYTPITFSAYANYLTGRGTIPAKPVVLTFDDGWKNQYEFAYPILQKYKFTGTFFIVTKSRTNGYMSWDDIRDLDVHGHEIASHTETHPKLTLITDPEKLHNEIFRSKLTLETELGHPITTIAYPYYQHNETIRSMVQQAGYSAARGGWGSFKNDIDHIFQATSQESMNNDNPFASKAQ